MTKKEWQEAVARAEKKLETARKELRLNANAAIEAEIAESYLKKVLSMKPAA